MWVLHINRKLVLMVLMLLKKTEESPFSQIHTSAYIYFILSDVRQPKITST